MLGRKRRRKNGRKEEKMYACSKCGPGQRIWTSCNDGYNTKGFSTQGNYNINIVLWGIYCVLGGEAWGENRSGQQFIPENVGMSDDRNINKFKRL